MVDIWAEGWRECSRGIYYEVREADKVVTRKTFFETDDGNTRHTYTIISAEQQNLIGVLEGSDLVIIQDFRTRETWPRLNDNELSYDPAVKAKWRDTFKRLKAENPKLQLPADLEEEASNHAPQ